MPKLFISREKEIDTPAEKVFNIISDLKQWVAWSPWLILDPEAKTVVNEEGNTHEWQGKRIGQGEMHIVNKVPNISVDYDLIFLKPWRSKVKVRFEIEEKENKSLVTWSMKGHLPFFLFWIKKIMIAALKMDYDRGLAMLKEFAEQGKVSSYLDFLGKSNFEGFRYVGIKRTANIDDLETLMYEDFKRLNAFFEGRENLLTGHVFSQYHKWDIVKGQAVYISGFGVNQELTDLPSDGVTGELPRIQVYTIKHTGSYHHLGNAWSAVISLSRSKEIRPTKAIYPLELYMNNPDDTPADKLITEIKIAVK